MEERELGEEIGEEGSGEGVRRRGSVERRKNGAEGGREWGGGGEETHRKRTVKRKVR